MNAVDSPKRHVKTVDSKQIEVGSWNGTEYEWLGVRLNIDEAYAAAGKLFTSLQEARNKLSEP